MKLGVLLPQLRVSADGVIAVAQAAERQGAAGVFAFDHLWWGQPTTPTLALFPLLAAVAARTSHITLGTLVARVDVMPLDHLVNAFRSLYEVAGDRLIAGLGIGDRVTEAEDRDAGVPPRSYDDRLELLEAAAVRLSDEGIPVWLAGASPQVHAIATRQGALVHLWEPDDARVRAQSGSFTWGGVLDGPAEVAATHLRAPLQAGAAWAVCGYRGGLDAPNALTTLLRANVLAG